MTGLTRYQQLPYPPSRRVRGNGAADVEALATKVDSQLDRIGAAWTVVQKPDSALYVLSSPVTGVVANSALYPMNPTTLSASWGAHPPPALFGPGSLSTPEAWGWYAISCSVSSQPSGTANVGSRRTLQVNDLDATGTQVAAQMFIREDYELGSGETINQIDFVAYCGQDWRIAMAFFHANTGSTLTLTTTATYIAFNRLMGTG